MKHKIEITNMEAQCLGWCGVVRADCFLPAVLVKLLSVVLM